MGTKRIDIKKLLAIAASLVCLFSLMQPWLRIGIRTSSYGMLGIDDVFEIFDGSSLEDVVEDLVDEIEYYSSTSREMISGRKAVVKIASALRDSKISPVETATIFSSVSNIAAAMDNGYGFDDLSDVQSNSALAVILMWLLLVPIATLCVYNLYAEVRRKKGHYRWCTVLYAVLLVLYIVATIFANSAARDSLSDEWILELAGISDPSLLHLQLLPFLGLALLAANWMLEKRIPKKEVDVSIPSRAEIYAGVKNVKDKLVWNCDCGATNPTSAKYCPKCGAARSLSIKETELETLDEWEIIPPATPGIPVATPSGGSRVKKRFKPMDEFDGDFAQQPTSPGDEGSRLKTRKSSQWDWEE